MKNKSTDVNKSGRPDNPTFPYKSNSKAAKCFEQIMRSDPAIRGLLEKNVQNILVMNQMLTNYQQKKLFG